MSEATVTNGESYERLKRKLALDPMELDQELIELPGLILEASECTADALASRDRAKNELDLAMAEAADHLRRQPVSDGKGGTKTRSEAQITTEVPLFESVVKATTELEFAKHSLALWQAMVDAMRAKKDALKTFSDLTISGYLSPNAALDHRRAEIRHASKDGVKRRRLVTSNTETTDAV